MWGDTSTADADESKLYEMMVGHASAHEYYQLKDQCEPEQEVVLEAEDLGLHGEFKHCSFKLHKKEILSFCGVVGSGKESLCSVLCGDAKPTAGTLKLGSKPIVLSNPHQALKKGILMVPKERNEESIVGILSVADNIAMSNYQKLKKGIMISRKAIVKQAAEWISTLRIKTSGYSEDLVQLSGGNAQKVVFCTGAGQ